MPYLNILWKWRRFFLINMTVVASVAVIVTLLLPVWYQSTASVLPPKESGMLSGLGAGSILKDLAVGSFGGSDEGTYNYFAILSSRTVMEAVVKKFDLINVYDIRDSSMEETLKALAENVSFEEQEDDNITIEVLDRDPQRAADIANYFVQLLNETSIRLGTEEAGNNRQFIERQLAATNERLKSAEDSLRMYQEKTGTIVAVDPTGGSISPIVELYTLKARKEIELAILRRSASEDNALVRQLEIELSEINRKVASYPGMGIESLRLYRELAIQQKILEFLVPLYEQAKVDEHRDIPVLLVLDRAVPAEYKTKPQRALIVLVVSFLSLLLMVALVLFVQTLLSNTTPTSDVELLFRRWGTRVASFYKVQA